jgi:hypothetical protein
MISYIEEEESFGNHNTYSGKYLPIDYNPHCVWCNLDMMPSGRLLTSQRLIAIWRCPTCGHEEFEE